MSAGARQPPALVPGEELRAARARSDRELLAYYELARAQLPAGTSWFDAHTHSGQHDPDGFTATADQIIASMDRAGHERALVFPFQEPDGYPRANDRVLAEAAASGGRLTALARLDPHSGALAEARRCLAAGAAGFKLHPRAERFTLDHPEVDRIVALAGEQRMPVLIHAGRGIPALGRHAAELARRHPQARLILAHLGISDLGWIWQPARELENLLFDTSWWSVIDLVAVFALIPPGQVVYASDTPYGSGVAGGLQTLRSALAAGLRGDALAAIAGGQLERIVAREQLLDVGPAPGPDAMERRPLAERASSYLHQAVAQAFARADPTQSLALALLACDVPAGTAEAPALAHAALLIERAQRALAAAPEEPRSILFDVLAAAAIAGTPDVPVPELAAVGGASDGRVTEAGAARAPDSSAGHDPAGATSPDRS